ncbi:uncharacterized protein LOC120133156 isoform X1 [Hibiscus syriacus]|uniref:uncharacterized protein LOC120133156 isoform X1 n=1 Tax=Hibiscus syriacus TaxID=106335 RepID=UPI0019213AA9|nr:uncharacterized protein LOC120133156 isoform X1 [Hibiscus syriacus]
MRTKTPAFRRRPRNSISPSNAQLIYPLHYQDEDNEEYHLHGSDNGESEDAGFSQDNDKNNDDVDGKDDAFDDDAEKEGDDDLVPDDVNEKDEDANYVVPDCVEGWVNLLECLADWLGVFSYISSGGSSPVLVCSENDCPIAMQEARMSTEPDFDDTGKFYCPYCWYKRVVARTEELRKEALLAKRELLNFIHSKRDDGNGEKQEDEASNMKAASLSTSRKENSGDFGNGLNDDVNETIYYNQGQVMCIVSKGKEKSVDGSTSKAHGADNVADGQIMQEEDIETVKMMQVMRMLGVYWKLTKVRTGWMD